MAYKTSLGKGTANFADMMDGGQLIPQDRPDPVGFFFITGRPPGIIGNHPYFYRTHQECVRSAALGISL